MKYKTGTAKRLIKSEALFPAPPELLFGNLLEMAGKLVLTK